jgi:hypothetical protein
MCSLVHSVLEYRLLVFLHPIDWEERSSLQCFQKLIKHSRSYAGYCKVDTEGMTDFLRGKISNNLHNNYDHIEAS